jgi:exodeoxyribonuclease VII large subunit
VARGDLAHAAGALRPSLLKAQAARCGERLAAIRFRPALIERRLDDAKSQVQRLWRLAEGLNPERPLAKGYAWVGRRPDGAVVTTAAQAKAAGALTLHFADGTVDAKVERGGRASYSQDKPEQPSLL